MADTNFNDSQLPTHEEELDFNADADMAAADQEQALAATVPNGAANALEGVATTGGTDPTNPKDGNRPRKIRKTSHRQRGQGQSTDPRAGESSYLISPDLLYYLVHGAPPASVTTKSMRDSLVVSARSFTWQAGLLYKVLVSGETRKVATREELPQIFAWCHEQGHVGQRATYDRVHRTYWWPGMKNACYAYVKHCINCQKQHDTSVRTDRELQPVCVEGMTPFQKLAIDFAGPLPKTTKGHKFLLVVVCYVTKWVEAIPLPSNTASLTAETFVNQIISRYGCPLEVASDNGSSFDGEFSELLQTWGVRAIRIAPYNPQSNGLVERCIKTLKGALSRMAGNRPHTWDQCLGWVLFAYRHGKQASTGFSPHYLLFGRNALLPEQLALLANDFTLSDSGDVQTYVNQLVVTSYRMQFTLQHAHANIVASQEQQRLDFAIRKKTQARRIQQIRDLPLGSLVLAQKPLTTVTGLQQSWRGPYRLLSFSSIAKKTALLLELDTNKTCRRAVAHLKPYHHSGLDLPSVAQDPAPLGTLRALPPREPPTALPLLPPP
jgi:hypothetical protein